MSRDEELQQHVEQMRRMLNDKGQEDILRAVGEKVGASIVDKMPDYPEPSGKTLPAIYSQMSKAQWRYKRVRGRWTKTGIVRKPPTPYMSKFPSDRARRGFWGALKGGSLHIPYRRTGTLGKSITREVQVQGKQGRIDIGTSISYAPGVIGNRSQQYPYHQDHWWRLDDVVAGMQGEIAQMTAAALIIELRKRVE